MRVVKNIIQLNKALEVSRREGKTVGFVPTMGSFHEGHLILMRQARKENDICVVSIYVNPKQFGPKEDLACYPRDFRRDSSLARKENVDIIYFPSDNDIYPQGYLTYVDVAHISGVLDGAFRPGHFRGVATIVAKLLNMVRPQALYLGQKDAVQCAVITAMVRDLNFSVRVRVFPTVREPDGLAMSSRNVFLSPQERRQAPVLNRALLKARERVGQGERSASGIIRMITDMITTGSKGKIQYVACVDVKTLDAVKKIEGDVLIAVAVFFGKTRLIDNVIIRINEPEKNKS